MGARRRADRLRLEPVASSRRPAEFVLAAGVLVLAITVLKPWGALGPGGSAPAHDRSAFVAASASPSGSPAPSPALGVAAIQSAPLARASTSPAPASASASGALSAFSIPCLPTDGWRLVVLQRAPGGGDYRSWIVVAPMVAADPTHAALAVVRLGSGVIGVGACAPGAADASIDAVVAPPTGVTQASPLAPASGPTQAKPIPLAPAGPAAVELYGAPAEFSAASGSDWRAGRYDLGIVLSTGQDGWVAVEIAA